MFPFKDPIKVRVRNEGDVQVKMGMSVIPPGEERDVSSTYLTPPVIMFAEEKGVVFECLIIGGKQYDLVQRVVPEEPAEAEEVEEPAEAEEPAEVEEPEEEVEVEEPAEEPAEVEEPDYSSMYKKELVELAKEKGVYEEGMLKDDLVEVLENVTTD